MTLSDHDGISSSLDRQAFSAEMKETPTRDLIVVDEDVVQVKRLPYDRSAAQKLRCRFRLSAAGMARC
jgi:hypothetical protein